MALDRALLMANLDSFYDFEDKVVLCVGTGRGQLLDPNIATAETVVIDRDEKTLAGRNTPRINSGTQGQGRTVVADFMDINIPGDVVYFEFCLHEMDDSKQAILHARTLAPDVVIFEHSPSSDWVFYAGEEEQVCRSAQALAHFPVKRRLHVCAEQTFKDHAELVAKLSTQGDLAIQRASRFAGVTNIVIPMKCNLALL